ncbi:hypothetical protein QJS66_03275 [Kocuria rhizophila]|nr:hypothetical protein QJS66_03275 [Kocuria rhizophila]
MSYEHRRRQDDGRAAVGKEKISDKGIRSAKKRVDPLRRQTGMARGGCDLSPDPHVRGTLRGPVA